MLDSILTRSCAWHEAYHAATAIILDDWYPLMVKVDPAEDDNLGGVMMGDWDDRDFTRDTMTTQLKVTLAGPVYEGVSTADLLDPSSDDWPVACGSDAKQIKDVCDWLGLHGGWSNVDYARCVFDVQTLVETRRFRAIAYAIADRLFDSEMSGLGGLLIQRELREIVETIDARHI